MNGTAIIAAAIGGAIGGATLGFLTPGVSSLAGAAFGAKSGCATAATIGVTGAISGVASGRSQQLAENLLHGEDWSKDLLDGAAIAREAVAGAASNAVGHGVTKFLDNRLAIKDWGAFRSKGTPMIKNLKYGIVEQREVILPGTPIEDFLKGVAVGTVGFVADVLGEAVEGGAQWAHENFGRAHPY